MSISLRVTEEAILDKIEDEFDIKIFDKAMQKHGEGQKSYTHEEVLKELGF